MVGISAAGWAEDLIFKHGILLSFVVLSMTGEDEGKGRNDLHCFYASTSGFYSRKNFLSKMFN
jgi:hypothetical protein